MIHVMYNGTQTLLWSGHSLEGSTFLLRYMLEHLLSVWYSQVLMLIHNFRNSVNKLILRFHDKVDKVIVI